MPPAIRVRDLRKSYGDRQAVAGIGFEVQAGETFGLLGPNGAGKTTTIHMLVGALRPDGGTIEIDGQNDPTRHEVKRSIGVCPQSLALYDELTGEANLAFFGRLYGLAGHTLRERVYLALETAGLADRRRQRVAGYSGGMKRRLNLACALLHEPRVLLLDEPTAGVDPQSRNHLFESIEALARSGTTIVYTTHYMEEAQRLCDRVAILDHGKLLALDTVEALITAHGGEAVVEATFAGDAPALPWPIEEGRLRVATGRPFDVVSELGKRAATLAHLAIERPDLERVFLNLTGRRLRD
jgi:ABC-2 type transport system ATP-binding protein